MLLLNKTGKKGKEVDNLPQILQYITARQSAVVLACTSAFSREIPLNTNTVKDGVNTMWARMST